MTTAIIFLGIYIGITLVLVWCALIKYIIKR